MKAALFTVAVIGSLVTPLTVLGVAKSAVAASPAGKLMAIDWKCREELEGLVMVIVNAAGDALHGTVVDSNEYFSVREGCCGTAPMKDGP